MTQVRTSPIAAGFNAWFPPDEDTVVRALREGLVIVDANVLLHLYRYDQELTKKWFEVFNALSGRLWIPNQVLAEFWKHRATLAAYQTETLKADSEIGRLLSRSMSVFKDWVTARGLDLTDDQQKIIDSLEHAAGEMHAEFREALETHQRRFDADPDRDEVTKLLAALTQRGTDSAVVGHPYTESELEDAHKAADTRYANSVPPGYMDDGQNQETKVGKSGPSKYGDYVLWEQSLRQAKDFAARNDGGESFVVLVTADLKDDWWQTYVTGGEGNERMARRELVEEMRREADATYVQLSPTGLLTHVTRALDVSIGDAAIATVSALETAGDGKWLPDTFVSETKWLRAEARVSRDGQRIRVLRGSQAKLDAAPYFSGTHKDLRDRLIEDGMLVPSAEGGFLEFTRDYEFAGHNSATSVIRGYPMGGRNFWRASNGSTLGDLLDSVGELDDDGVPDVDSADGGSSVGEAGA